MKKLTKALAALLIASMLAAPVFASSISLNINGSTVKTTVSPYQTEGITLVPLRVISEQLGATVNWDAKAQTITIVQDSNTIVLTVGSKVAKVNGVSQSLAVAPQVKNNSTMVPIRFVSENLNCNVNWDTTTQTVFVTEKSETVVSEDGSFTITNPQMLAGVPVLTVDWMEKNLGVDVTYYQQYNRYSVTSKDRSSKITISEKNRWISINSAEEPYIGDYDCGKDKSTAKISIDIVAKAYGYTWSYDEVTKVLLAQKIVEEEIVLQEPVNGYVTVKGYVKYLDTLKPASNINVNLEFKTANGTIKLRDTAITDNNGYYAYKIAVSEIEKMKFERVAIKCLSADTKLIGQVRKYEFTQENPDGKYLSVYADIMPTFYISQE